MKILLIHPRDMGYRYRGLLCRQPSYTPLTVTTLAGLVQPELEAEVSIIDEAVEQVSFNG